MNNRAYIAWLFAVAVLAFAVLVPIVRHSTDWCRNAGGQWVGHQSTGACIRNDSIIKEPS